MLEVMCAFLVIGSAALVAVVVCAVCSDKDPNPLTPGEVAEVRDAVRNHPTLLPDVQKLLEDQGKLHRRDFNDVTAERDRLLNERSYEMLKLCWSKEKIDAAVTGAQP